MVDTGFNGQVCVTQKTQEELGLIPCGSQSTAGSGGIVRLHYCRVWVKWGRMERAVEVKAYIWHMPVDAIGTSFL
jgi:predicted aspartyl protease